ncbi:GMC oxidoreductase [Sistotremastrum niveocremeum HHB9708]|uniref:GMC oxidoreductase n=1 Tax=Sistotremastrum niveocremeum HHB9708 TaxID=1314777 RepID=A0A165ADQ8_9AGAM|nr:GMC oxidoreductase [Sistotremastrum niveocremeum HHB9708]
MEHLASIDEISGKSFDFVIIGGGTAGLTLASRLSEDQSLTIALLEAGPANLDDPLILRTSQYGAHFGKGEYEWGQSTIPQVHANGKSFYWPRGRTLGGSSAINFLCWTKPPRQDIDDIERLGNEGWGWDSYEKYVRRVERFVHLGDDGQIAPGLTSDGPNSTTEGPLIISYPQTIENFEKKAYETLKTLGIPDAPAPLDGDPAGTYACAHTFDPISQTRTYSTTAYYLPVAHRKNLRVLVSATVSKIVLNDEEKGSDVLATGVEFIYEGKRHVVHASKEVILSAGSLKSPQILELSGIGRRDVLEPLGIPVAVDLPGVGENLQEHVFTGVSWEMRDGLPDLTLDILRDPEQLAQQIKAYESKQPSLFTSGISGFTFQPLTTYTPRAQNLYDELSAKINENQDSYPPGLKEQYEIQLERLEKGAPAFELISFPGFFSYPNPPEAGKKYVTMLFASNHMFSRGNAHISSTDPLESAALDPHYFEQDFGKSPNLKSLVEVTKFVRKIVGVKPYDEIAGDVPKEINPGPGIQSDEQLADWVKSSIGSTYHTLGTLSMLPKEKNGVVDPTLKVYGTKNIRVVDLSIVPLHIAAHTLATVYSIAEHAADIIKESLTRA